MHLFELSEKLHQLEPQQRHHCVQILDQFVKAASEKYAKGQLEHGGNLFDVPSLLLIDFAIEEAIDQVIYLLTLRDKLRKELPDGFNSTTRPADRR